MILSSLLRDDYGFFAREKVNGLWAQYPIGQLPSVTWSPIGIKQLLLPSGIDVVAMDCKKPETPDGFWILGSATLHGETFTVRGREPFRQLAVLKQAFFSVTMVVDDSLGFSPSLAIQLGVHTEPLKTKPSPLLPQKKAFGLPDVDLRRFAGLVKRIEDAQDKQPSGQ